MLLLFFFAGFNVGCNQRQRLRCVLKWVMWARRIIFTASHIKGDCQILYRSSIAPTTKSEQKSEKIHILRRNEHKQAMNNQVALSLPLMLNTNHKHTKIHQIHLNYNQEFGCGFLLFTKRIQSSADLLWHNKKSWRYTQNEDIHRTYTQETVEKLANSKQNDMTEPNVDPPVIYRLIRMDIDTAHKNRMILFTRRVFFLSILSSFLKGVACMGF